MTDGEFKTILKRLDEIERQTGAEKVWDLAMKALIPVVLALGTWMIGLEVRASKMEAKFENMPPQWLKNDVASIKETLKEIESRLRIIEGKK